MSVLMNQLKQMDKGWRVIYEIEPGLTFDCHLPRLSLAVQQEPPVPMSSLGNRRRMVQYNRAIFLGWSVLRFTPQQIYSGYALDIIKQVYEQRNTP
jgi:hypothetical protein